MHIAFIHNNIKMHKIDKEVGSNFINFGQITTQSKWKKIGDLKGMFKFVNHGQTTLDLKWKINRLWFVLVESHQITPKSSWDCVYLPYG